MTAGLAREIGKFFDSLGLFGFQPITLHFEFAGGRASVGCNGRLHWAGWHDSYLSLRLR